MTKQGWVDAYMEEKADMLDKEDVEAERVAQRKAPAGRVAPGVSGGSSARQRALEAGASSDDGESNGGGAGYGDDAILVL